MMAERPLAMACIDSEALGPKVCLPLFVVGKYGGRSLNDGQRQTNGRGPLEVRLSRTVFNTRTVKTK